MASEPCILCKSPAEYTPLTPTEGEYKCVCPNCGEYLVSEYFRLFEISEYSKSDKALISGYIREVNESSKAIITISSDNAKDILENSIVARSINSKLIKFLLFMAKRTSYLGEAVTFNTEFNFAVLYAMNQAEASEIIEYGVQKKYIIQSSNVVFRLTFTGLSYIEELEKITKVSNSAFVAMWFSNEMKEIYEAAIKPAIEAKECGAFKAFRVDNHEHNNDITDEIIAGIKACRFMVADMTGYRGGVYFEAGFAKGLGKPVIFTCRKDWFTGEYTQDGKPIKERVHFDINHQNIIVWDNPEDLKQRIINRIRATII